MPIRPMTDSCSVNSYKRESLDERAVYVAISDDVPNAYHVGVEFPWIRTLVRHKPQSHRIVRFLDRAIGCDWAQVLPIGNVCYDLQQRRHTAIDLYAWSRFFFSSPAQCWAQDLARGLNSSRSSWVHGCGRMGQTSRCFMVCSFPHSHVNCLSILVESPFLHKGFASSSPCPEAI